MINATIWQRQFFPGCSCLPMSTERGNQAAQLQSPSSGARPAAVC